MRIEVLNSINEPLNSINEPLNSINEPFNSINESLRQITDSLGTDKSKNIPLLTLNGHQSSVINFKPDNLFLKITLCPNLLP
ncbi:MAG: hypothetical protein PUP90_22595 [Nostoc sp. S4]|nr:hypothetical protein [Nostoc sp. S4]